jgi:hypothetical protein
LSIADRNTGRIANTDALSIADRNTGRIANTDALRITHRNTLRGTSYLFSVGDRSEAACNKRRS